MAHRKSRKSNSSGFGLASRLFSPFRRAGEGVSNSVRRVSRGVGNVAGTVVRTATGVGNTFARKTDQALANVLKRRKSRRNNTRRNNTRRRRN